MKQLVLLLLAISAVAACKDEVTGPSEGPIAEIRADRPPGVPPDPPGPPTAPQSGTISGRKFHDLDADGTDDGGTDPALSGWTIHVYADADKDGIRDASEFASGPVASAVTDAAGGYEITVNPGRYIVCEVMEPGWSQSAPANSICAPDPGAAHGGYAVKITGASSSTGNDFGNFQPGTVSGRKFEDLDGDGTDDGGTDPDFGGWTIRAYEDTDEDGVLDFAEFNAGAAATDLTDPNGEYELTLEPGKYLVCEVAKLVGGFIVWHQSLPRGPEAVWGPHLPFPTDLTCATGATGGDLMSGGYAVTMASGGDETGRDFGNYLKGSVSGRKFNDNDQDGTDDGGTDPGLSGWLIFAFFDADGDGVLDASEIEDFGLQGQDETNANGEYEFTVHPGRYIVCEVQEDGWAQSEPANTICAGAEIPGFPHAPGGLVVTVTSGGTHTGNDFGNFEEAEGTVSGRKFEDLDGDGTDDGGTDPDFGGWTIRAYEDTDEDGVLDFAEFDAGAAATDLTDPNGEYELTLVPGKYLVCEVAKLVGGFIVWHQSLPRGPEASWGPHLPPADLTCAVGASAGDLMSGGYAVTMASGGDETDRDFGNYLRGSVSGRKFNDNGTDPGLSGWLIFAFFDADGDGVLDASEIEDFGLQGQDETDANGEYGFTVHPGRYIVCEVQEDGWAQSEPANTICAGAESPGFPHAPGGLVVTVTSGSTETGNDFGNFQP